MEMETIGVGLSVNGIDVKVMTPADVDKEIEQHEHEKKAYIKEHNCSEMDYYVAMLENGTWSHYDTEKADALVENDMYAAKEWLTKKADYPNIWSSDDSELANKAWEDDTVPVKVQLAIDYDDYSMACDNMMHHQMPFDEYKERWYRYVLPRRQQGGRQI